MLPALLAALNAIEGIEWIRLLYCYPEEVDEELIDAIARNKKVCHYLDMPIQHINSDILRRMGRRTSREDIESVICLLRQRIPDIAIRTTLISGFPGETIEQHEELMQFVNDTEFDRLGVFPYSAEDDTPACSFPDQVPEKTRKAWADEVMELQAEVSLDKNREMIGCCMDVLIEGRLAEEDGVYLGRSYRDAPDIDGYVFVRNEYELLSGTIVPVRITEAYEYDLFGEIVQTQEEC
jgi:ribosomal protein S12 methylthiotransferase